MFRFYMPDRLGREAELNRGVFKWLLIPNIVTRYDPDCYVWTKLIRFVFGFSIITNILIIAFLFFSSIDTNHTLYWRYCYLVDTYLPFSVLAVIYYYFYYEKTVDQEKYNFLMDRAKGKEIPLGHAGYFFALLSLYPVLFPSGILGGMFEVERRIHTYEIFFDSYVFLLVTSIITTCVSTFVNMSLFFFYIFGKQYWCRRGRNDS